MNVMKHVHKFLISVVLLGLPLVVWAQGDDTLPSVLSGTTCERPCFLGIEPMITSRTQLETILSEQNIEFEIDPLGLNAEIDTAPVLLLGSLQAL